MGLMSERADRYDVDAEDGDDGLNGDWR
jgi:hypothetical protein